MKLISSLKRYIFCVNSAQSNSEPAGKVTKLKLHSIGTDRFVVDVDSLYDSEGVKAQADAASKLGGGCV